VFDLRTAVSTTHKTSTAVLAFHRDMSLITPFVANLRSIQERRQQIIDLSAAREKNAAAIMIIESINRYKLLSQIQTS
jgi:hypothetical protein